MGVYVWSPRAGFALNAQLVCQLVLEAVVQGSTLPPSPLPSSLQKQYF